MAKLGRYEFAYFDGKFFEVLRTTRAFLYPSAETATRATCKYSNYFVVIYQRLINLVQLVLFFSPI